MSSAEARHFVAVAMVNNLGVESPTAAIVWTRRIEAALKQQEEASRVVLQAAFVASRS